MAPSELDANLAFLLDEKEVPEDIQNKIQESGLTTLSRFIFMAAPSMVDEPHPGVGVLPLANQLQALLPIVGGWSAWLAPLMSESSALEDSVFYVVV